MKATIKDFLAYFGVVLAVAVITSPFVYQDLTVKVAMNIIGSALGWAYVVRWVVSMYRRRW